MRRTSGSSTAEERQSTSNYSSAQLMPLSKNGLLQGSCQLISSSNGSSSKQHSLNYSLAPSAFFSTSKHSSSRQLINSNRYVCKSATEEKDFTEKLNVGTESPSSDGKRKGRVTVLCLLLSALLTLFGLSMFIQVLVLSSSLENSKVLVATSGDAFPQKLTFFQSFLFTDLTNPPKHSSPLSNDDVIVLNDALLSDSENGASGSINEQVTEKTEMQQQQTIPEKSDTDHWQPVRTFSSQRFFVYSAYIDEFKRSNLNPLTAFAISANSSQLSDYDPHRFVRVIAATLLKTKVKVACCYHLSPEYEVRQSLCHEGTSKPIREHWNLKYSAYFLFCPLPQELSLKTDADIAANWSLSIVATKNDSNVALQLLLQNKVMPSNLLNIHDSASKEEEEMSFAVCVKPLHYEYNRYIAFLEWIELNRLLGVGHFYFYNHTVGPEVELILKSLLKQQQQPLITVLPWQLPVASQSEVRTEGIFAALNDCLYRARAARHQYVLFIDLDEYIVPQRHHSLPELIASLKRIYRRQSVAAYVFRNAFFYLEYPNELIELPAEEGAEQEGERDGQQFQLAEQLITLSKTRRKATLNVHKQRSKFIASPEDTVEVGNHFVWELSSGKSSLNVHSQVAKMHHYRKCEYGGDECITHSASLVDRRVAVWAPQLVSAVQRQLHFICSFTKQLYKQRQSQHSQMCQF